jgi:hypothetical protein
LDRLDFGSGLGLLFYLQDFGALFVATLNGLDFYGGGRLVRFVGGHVWVRYGMEEEVVFLEQTGNRLLSKSSFIRHEGFAVFSRLLAP